MISVIPYDKYEMIKIILHLDFKKGVIFCLSPIIINGGNRRIYKMVELVAFHNYKLYQSYKKHRTQYIAFYFDNYKECLFDTNLVEYHQQIIEWTKTQYFNYFVLTCYQSKNKVTSHTREYFEEELHFYPFTILDSSQNENFSSNIIKATE